MDIFPWQGAYSRQHCPAGKLRSFHANRGRVAGSISRFARRRGQHDEGLQPGVTGPVFLRYRDRQLLVVRAHWMFHVRLGCVGLQHPCPVSMQDADLEGADGGFDALGGPTERSPLPSL